MSSYTLDASVITAAFAPAEHAHTASFSLLNALHELRYPIFVPTLLYPEVAAAFARSKQNRQRALQAHAQLRRLTFLRPVALDEVLSDKAAQLAITHNLRGADAVYAAVAQRYSAILVSHDQDHLARIGELTVLTAQDALLRLTT